MRNETTARRDHREASGSGEPSDRLALEVSILLDSDPEVACEAPSGERYVRKVLVSVSELYLLSYVRACIAEHRGLCSVETRGDETALTALTRTEAELLITDHLAGMSEIAKKNIPVVFLADEQADGCSAFTTVVLVRQPFNAKRLLKAVVDALDGRTPFRSPGGQPVS